MPTQNRCHLFPNNVRPAFYPVKSVIQFRQSILRASLRRELPSHRQVSVGKYKQEQVNHPIYNGLQIERRGPPVVIYNGPLASI